MRWRWRGKGGVGHVTLFIVSFAYWLSPLDVENYIRVKRFLRNIIQHFSAEFQGRKLRGPLDLTGDSQ